jgi:hypothetical protein
MGLAVEVGYLSDLLANDQEGANWFLENMARLNRYLASVGLPAHREPQLCRVFSWICTDTRAFTI